MYNLSVKIFILTFISIQNINGQTDIDRAIKGGELLINGLSIIRNNKSETKNSNSKFVESVCIKNKLSEKITFSFIGKDEEDNVVKKELVIQKDDKECVFELPKGIYTYEIVMPNNEVFKKGEYKFNEEITITVKKD